MRLIYAFVILAAVFGEAAHGIYLARVGRSASRLSPRSAQEENDGFPFGLKEKYYRGGGDQSRDSEWADWIMTRDGRQNGDFKRQHPSQYIPYGGGHGRRGPSDAPSNAQYSIPFAHSPAELEKYENLLAYTGFDAAHVKALKELSRQLTELEIDYKAKKLQLTTDFLFNEGNKMGKQLSLRLANIYNVNV